MDQKHKQPLEEKNELVYESCSVFELPNGTKQYQVYSKYFGLTILPLIFDDKAKLAAYGSGISAMRQASGATSDRYAQIQREGKTAVLGNSMNTPDIYAGWQDVDLGNSFRSLFRCDLPTLFVSGTFDSNTPISNVEELLPWFSKAQHLILENAGHEDMLPNAELQQEIIRFFRKQIPIRTSVILPKPRFVPFF